MSRKGFSILAAVATIAPLVLTLSVGTAASSARNSGFAARAEANASTIPALERTRIAAEYGRQLALLPSWLPPGVSLESWTVESGSYGYLLDRLQLRFRKGGDQLVWEVASAVPEETEDHADCRPGMGARHVIAGRGIYYVNNTTGVEAAWLCTKVRRGRFQPEIAATAWQVAGRRGASWQDLLRIAASAKSTPVSELTRASPLVPSEAARALRQAYGMTLPFPTLLPKGFIFTRWWIYGRTSSNPKIAYAMFGRDGRRLQWSVSRSGHKYDFNCPRTGSPTWNRRAVVAGRTVYLIEGTVGQAAWICTAGPRPTKIEMWNDYSVSGATLMRIVATSRA